MDKQYVCKDRDTGGSLELKKVQYYLIQVHPASVSLIIIFVNVKSLIVYNVGFERININQDQGRTCL